MKLRDKVASWFSDRYDDIDFLLRKDVSARFKLLNLLSGDRLRYLIIFARFRIKDAIEVYDDLPEYKAWADGALTDEDYEHILRRIMWYIKRAERNLDDIWTM